MSKRVKLDRTKQTAGFILILGLAAAVHLPASAASHRRVAVEGLHSESKILVDRWGVPHIYAKSPVDAFFTQGWNAARDRLWQIDLWRRTGLGELSAALGDKYVAKDRAIRLFVYRGDMSKEWAAYGPNAQRNTEAFVSGINAFVAAAKADPKLVPPEFALAGYEPAFWKAEDVVRVRNHVLSFNLFVEVARAQMACKDGSANQPLPVVLPHWTPVVPEGLDFCSIPPNVLEQYYLGMGGVTFSKAATAATTDNVESTPWGGNERSVMQGSNNWVIGPGKTATGRPILANDPHRSEDVPSVRYLAHLVAPGLNIIGAGEPAVPGISLGHNEHVAFGLTVFFIAQDDLYVYETNPDEPNQYRYGNGWEPMRIAHESIAVRGGTARSVELKFTRHGPVVMEDPAHHRAYAVRATWLDTGGAPYMGSLHYQRAATVDEFGKTLKHWGEPGSNQVVADTRGRIGWFPAGFTPRRPNTDGLLPLPGDGRYEWDGYLDHNLLPSEIDPDRGYIATANQMNLPAGYPYKDRRVSFFWIDPSRFNRISEVLTSLPKVSVNDSERLQNEYITFPGRRLVRLLGTLATSDPQLAEAARWLAGWDANVTAESAQAALYEVWTSRHLVPAVIAKVAGSLPPTLTQLIGDEQLLHITEMLEHPDERFGENPREARDEVLLNSLSSALADTNKLLGADRSQWQWGMLSKIEYEHPLAPLADEAQ